MHCIALGARHLLGASAASDLGAVDRGSPMRTVSSPGPAGAIGDLGELVVRETLPAVRLENIADRARNLREKVDSWSLDTKPLPFIGKPRSAQGEKSLERARLGESPMWARTTAISSRLSTCS